MQGSQRPPYQHPQLGQHIVSIADDPSTQLDLLALAFHTALSHDCQCVYAADRLSGRDLVNMLAARGCDLSRALETGQFRSFTWEEVYAPSGRFDPEWLIAELHDAIEAARANGFAGLCAAGEAGWLWRERVPGADRILEYEHRVNLLDNAHYAAVICLYDAGLVRGWLEAELLKSHPLVHKGNQIQASPLFVSDHGSPADVPLVEELEPPADELPCEMLSELISAYADRELLGRRADELVRHLATCDRCVKALAGHLDVKRTLASTRRPATVPPALWRRVQQRLDDDTD